MRAPVEILNSNCCCGVGSNVSFKKTQSTNISRAFQFFAIYCLENTRNLNIPKTIWNSRITATFQACAFGLAIGLIALSLLGAGVVIVSQFWWAFIGVGFVLLTAILLLAASLAKKFVLYLPVLVLCVSFLEIS